MWTALGESKVSDVWKLWQLDCVYLPCVPVCCEGRGWQLNSGGPAEGLYTALNLEPTGPCKLPRCICGDDCDDDPCSHILCLIMQAADPCGS